MDAQNIVMWYGTKIDELSKDELIDALNWCAGEIELLRSDRDRWIRAGDPVKYLMDGNNQDKHPYSS